MLSARHAEFSSRKPVDGALVIAEPFTAWVEDEGACLIENEIAGKVVLIAHDSHGGQILACNFASKAVCAQDAGAVGVIIMNIDATNSDEVVARSPWFFSLLEPITVSIPVVMVSHNEGMRIKALGTGTPVAFASANKGNEAVIVQMLREAARAAHVARWLAAQRVQAWYARTAAERRAAAEADARLL